MGDIPQSEAIIMAIQVRGIMTNSHRGQVFKKCFNFVQQTVIPGGVKPPETQEHLSGVAGPAPGGRGQRWDEREVQAVAQGPERGTPALRTLNRRQLPALGRRADSQDSPNRVSRTEVCVPRDGRLIDE